MLLHTVRDSLSLTFLLTKVQRGWRVWTGIIHSVNWCEKPRKTQVFASGGFACPHIEASCLDLEIPRCYYKAIDFCVDLGIPVVQVAGYFAYYEPDDPEARERYLEVLAQALPYAEQRGIILAIENVDGNDLAAIPDAMEVLKELPSPWLQIYPDIGNIAEHGGDATTELAAGENHMVAIHVKDVLPGQPRRIPLGEGVADFSAAFSELARRIMLEMWNDDSPDSIDKCVAGREWLQTRLREAGITVISPEIIPERK